VGSINGQLTRFIFGSKLPSGGDLVGLYTWSIDGGDGVDDYLVAMGRGGDVVLYRGSDPEQPDWQTVGTWFIGKLTQSRRCVAEYGPDLFMLSTFGITSLADLLRGVPANQQSPSQKVNRFLRNDVERGKLLYEWQLVVHPGDGFMQVITPKPNNGRWIQYTMNLQTQAWGFWRDVPILGAASWEGDYFMGSTDGRVFINEGGRDNEQLPGENQWSETEVVPPGPEWTKLAPDSWAVDGSQDTTTQVLVLADEPLKQGVKYEVFYKIRNWVSGRHSLTIEENEVVPASVDDGVFVATYIPTDPDDQEISIVATVDGIMEFYDITVREATEAGEPINFAVLTSFQAPQGHAMNSMVGLIRTQGIFAGTANLNCRAVYDYRVEARLKQPPLINEVDPGIWDSGIWDLDIWDYETRGQNFIGGSLGMGKPFAVLCVGNSMTRVTIVSWDLHMKAGGFM
jgi:hypothetical protein